ncbi:peptidase domain-containing ABC transporter [Chryseolinea sp. T2]|uniref:peptidase domain-containing ABC transporter n=1 Tax=Chryseolinea sp. T2 TaxID=3129255 RepID=UPI0030771600
MSIKVKQHDVSDCGAACILSVASHYRLMLSIARIRQMAGTSGKGTTIAGLVEALTALGFDAKGVRGDISALMNVPKPAIAHVMPRAGFHHYVVIYGAESNHVELMDPADGRIHHYSNDEFLEQWTGVMVLMLPNDKFTPGNRKTPAWRRLWNLMKSHKSVMLQALIGSLVFTLIGLSTSIYVEKIVDHVLPDGNRNLLNMMGVIMIILLLVQTFLGNSKARMVLQTGQHIDAQLILGYYSHLIRLPQAFFDRMRIGEITSRINDAMKIRLFINDAVVNVAVNVFIVVSAFVLMFTHHWKLAIVMMSALPAYALLYVVSNRLHRRVERELMERSADLESQIVESLSAVSTIKNFCMLNYEDRKTESRFVPVLQSAYASGRNSIIVGQAGEFISKMFTIVLLWTGAGFVLNHEMTAGELLSFYALLEYFSGPVVGLIGMNKTFQNAIIASDRLLDVMDLEPEEQASRAILTSDQLGDIVFRDVGFRYDASLPVFQHLNLLIKQREVTAIVGESGSGKSTIISIIQRLYPVQAGSVKIGFYDLRYLDLQSLRTVVSVVPQQIDLFAGTIVENIAAGVPEPDLARVIDICTMLNILEFIEKLPQGLFTMIGEHGSTLSGGQRQRIAIARALYREPEILALDEATSALDAGAEQYVHRMIDLMRERRKTVIIIAHRLSTVMRADKIIVLSGGRVVEEGTHESLMASAGHYRKLWIQQFPLPENHQHEFEVLPLPEPVDKEVNANA